MRTIYTVTSPNGQVLHGEHNENDSSKYVLLSSKAGNHGMVTVEEWKTKLDNMLKAGFKVEIIKKP